MSQDNANVRKPRRKIRTTVEGTAAVVHHAFMPTVLQRQRDSAVRGVHATGSVEHAVRILTLAINLSFVRFSGIDICYAGTRVWQVMRGLHCIVVFRADLALTLGRL